MRPIVPLLEVPSIRVIEVLQTAKVVIYSTNISVS